MLKLRAVRSNSDWEHNRHHHLTAEREHASHYAGRVIPTAA
jgi:hypothetical protein